MKIKLNKEKNNPFRQNASKETFPQEFNFEQKKGLRKVSVRNLSGLKPKLTRRYQSIDKSRRNRIYNNNDPSESFRENSNHRLNYVNGTAIDQQKAVQRCFPAQIELRGRKKPQKRKKPDADKRK